jgi:hypothetical protein
MGKPRTFSKKAKKFAKKKGKKAQKIISFFSHLSS